MLCVLKYDVALLGDLYFMMMMITDLEGLISVQDGSMLYELCLEPLTCCCTSKLRRSSRNVYFH
jgi:hypothetical protein